MVVNGKIYITTNRFSILQVQDFRFLCPNGTAFDQESQICAEWDDVDCEAATLYYSSDNFDLYRVGSGTYLYKCLKKCMIVSKQ